MPFSTPFLECNFLSPASGQDTASGATGGQAMRSVPVLPVLTGGHQARLLQGASPRPERQLDMHVGRAREACVAGAGEMSAGDFQTSKLHQHMRFTPYKRGDTAALVALVILVLQLSARKQLPKPRRLNYEEVPWVSLLSTCPRPRRR